MKEKIIQPILKNEAETFALEKLKGLGKILDYYDKNKDVLVNMTGEQKDFTKDQIIEYFKKCPTLFHTTSGDEDKILKIAKEGLTTDDFRRRVNNIIRQPKDINFVEIKEMTPEEEESYFINMENEMNKAYHRASYNNKYFSSSFVPWWNEKYMKGENNLLENRIKHRVNKDGKIDISLSIALDEKESREIIEKNLNEIKEQNPKSEFGKLVHDRLVSYAETLEPYRTAPRHFVAIFLLEGKMEEIKDDKDKQTLLNFIERLGNQCGTPIFNFYGDMLWPKQVRREEVKKLIGI